MPHPRLRDAFAVFCLPRNVQFTVVIISDALEPMQLISRYKMSQGMLPDVFFAESL
jgi:hypothetical protein